MAKYTRRQYLIDKHLQVKFALLTILLLVVYTLLFAASLFAPHMIDLSVGATLDEQTEAARVLLSLHKSVWPTLGLLILLLGAISIFFTHKIAGPVYRFKRVLQEVASGNLGVSITLRKRDELKDLADDLNAVIGELRIFVQTLQDDHAAMSSCIEELEEQIKANQINSETGSELVRRLKASRDKSAHQLEKYSG